MVHTVLAPCAWLVFPHQDLVMLGVEPSLFSLTEVKWEQTTPLALYGLMTEPQGPRVLAYPG